jgi:hypothetical protein
MKHGHLDELALRREALTARAELQRIELGAALAQLRAGSVASRGVAAIALSLARSLAASRSDGAPAALRARPWMLSAGVLLVRALRASPTARWVAAAGALGAAIWWVARALRTPDEGQDDSG